MSPTTEPPEPRELREPARGSELLRAVAVMEALRADDGDAWTHRQTHASLARYLLEETHEVLEVIDEPERHGPGALADELGDLLFQILFHARIGQEADPSWDIDDVARSFVAKMERRNPHVFGEDRGEALADPADVEQIVAQWHAVKAAEREAAGPASGSHRTDDAGEDWFDRLPAQLPALQKAAKAVHRARSDGGLDRLLQVADRMTETEGATEDGSDIARALLDLVVAAEARDVDPETALRSLLARTGTALADGGTRDSGASGTSSA